MRSVSGFHEEASTFMRSRVAAPPGIDGAEKVGSASKDSLYG
jgi:hypothetical protein